MLILLVPNQSFKKRKDTRGLFERFFYILLLQKRLLTQLFLVSLSYTLLVMNELVINNNSVMELKGEELEETNGGGIGITIVAVCAILCLMSSCNGCADAVAGK